jgi:hypothetical protein
MVILYRANVVVKALARSNLLFYEMFLLKKRLPRRQKARAAARNDINL